ncbi:hypothetical protein [Sutcliffiella horikoshii]|uniref:hypothetical protein n=1 Tax=Sutcliffiella horikoshii TaxID=79883 RepID=UPI001CFC781D|nr:hypothetical protein [Sutcliffiella horikoshii]
MRFVAFLVEWELIEPSRVRADAMLGRVHAETWRVRAETSQVDAKMTLVRAKTPLVRAKVAKHPMLARLLILFLSQLFHPFNPVLNFCIYAIKLIVYFYVLFNNVSTSVVSVVTSSIYK